MSTATLEPDIVLHDAIGPCGFVIRADAEARDLRDEPELWSLLLCQKLHVAAERRIRSGTNLLVVHCNRTPPPFVQEVALAAGAWVVVGKLDEDAVRWKSARFADGSKMDTVINAAFERLASKTLASLKLPFSFPSLQVVEQWAWEHRPAATEDDACWSLAMRLAAVTGEWIRKRAGGGRWQFSTLGSSASFTMRTRWGVECNALSKAEKFLESGPDEESLTQFVRVALRIHRERETGR